MARIAVWAGARFAVRAGLSMGTVACDHAVNWQIGFQDPASPFAEGIIRFHHDLMIVLVGVVVLVAWMMTMALRRWSEARQGNPSGNIHGSVLEIVWTMVPAMILMVIALPSFALLYSMEEVIRPAMTRKVVGHQWYWSYEYSDRETEDGEGREFDSYMVADDDLEAGDLRLLTVDNAVVLPVDTHIRVVITAADVLHCWTLPSLGVKLDACPGRLNQASLYINRPGVFRGQCSEICGVNHGFMPIVVEAVSMAHYVDWLVSMYEVEAPEQLNLADGQGL